MTEALSRMEPQLVRAEGGRIVDPAGRPVLRRGIGIGNWLLPEGYMWGFTDPTTSPRAIERLIAELVGVARAETFWAGFRRAFFTEDDVAAIATAGFDHVRLPINSRVVMSESGDFIEAGFQLVEQCVRWCEKYGLHVVLDLHGAPGGQTGTNIDDSPRGLPELFMDARYRDLTERLWLELSARYRTDETVAAYDLLNEPLPNEHQHTYADALALLYRRLTASLRAAGDEHLLMYEGSHWANNWSIFTEVWDENSALQFHKYWSAPDRASIRSYVSARERLGLPIYMGEGGENSVEWLQTAFQLFEDAEIGWNLWTWKKIETPTSPCSIRAPRGWDAIVSAAAGIGHRPDAEDAWRTLVSLLDLMRIEKCRWNRDVVNAVFRRAPLTIPATGYTFDGPELSGTAPLPSAPQGFREGDGPQNLRTRPDSAMNPFAASAEERAEAGGFEIVLQPGDQVTYEVGVSEERPIVVRAVGTNLADLRMSWDDGRAFAVDTGSGPRAVTLPPGRHRLSLHTDGGSATLSLLHVDLID